MSGDNSQRWPTVGVFVALGVLVTGIQSYHFTTLVEFTYHVAATTQSVATEAAQSSDSQGTVIYQFTDLPATAQDAFLRAYESTNNQTTIRGMEHQVTELGHTGDTVPQPGGGLYYVVYQESYYEFLIRHPMSFDSGTLVGMIFTAVGLLYSIYVILTHKPRTRTFLAVAAGIGGLLGVYGLTGWWGLNDFLALLIVGALCAYLPAIGAWYSYETLHS